MREILRLILQLSWIVLCRSMEPPGLILPRRTQQLDMSAAARMALAVTNLCPPYRGGGGILQGTNAGVWQNGSNYLRVKQKKGREPTFTTLCCLFPLGITPSGMKSDSISPWGWGADEIRENEPDPEATCCIVARDIGAGWTGTRQNCVNFA